MQLLKIKIASFDFEGRLETDLAPKSCAMFAKLLPFENKVIHVRWSGEGVWIPFGDQHFSLGWENATSHPAPGQFILYPGGVSEAEILLAYAGVCFSSKVGQLAGNHFMTITKGLEQLPELGRTVLWEGAQSIRIEKM